MVALPENISRDGTDTVRTLTQRLVTHLRRNESRDAKETFARLFQSAPPHVGIAHIKKALSRDNRHGLLLDFLLSDGAEVGFGLALAAEASLLGSVLNRYAEVEDWLQHHGRAGVPWTNYDYLKNIVPRGDPLVPRLRALKYPDLPDFRTPDDLIAYAEKLADRILISQPALDNLYRRSQFSGLPRDVWEQRVRVAFCIDHLTTDIPERGWGFLFDKAATLRVLDSLDKSKGNLLMTSHGGFTRLAVDWLSHAIPGHLILVGKNTNRKVTARTDRPEVFADEGLGAALFALHRAIEEKQTVLMAPDSHIGAMKSSINIFGRDRPLADGAAFLAYETRCPATWYVVTRQGSKFSPFVLPAPARGDAESYKQFRSRLYGFYAEQIESMATGDPDNLVLKQGWMRELEAHPVNASTA